MADLKLGPLPKQRTVRIPVVLSELLKEELDAYAVEFSKNNGPVKTAELIPHILQTYLRSDRNWCSLRKQMRQEQNGQRRVKSTSDANIDDRMK